MSDKFKLHVVIRDPFESYRRGHGGYYRFSGSDKATILREAYDCWQKWPDCEFRAWWSGEILEDFITGDKLLSLIKDYL